MASDGVTIFGHILGYGVAAIGIIVAWSNANKAKIAAENANEIAKKNTALAAELEIVKFREKWLYNIRNEIAQLLTFIDNVTPKTTDDELAKIHQHKNAVFLMLNMSEDLHVQFCEKSATVLAQNLGGIAKDKNGNKMESVTDEDLQNTAQNMLKKEWERIKNDLREYKNAKN